MKKLLPKLTSAIVFAMAPGFFQKLLEATEDVGADPFDDMASVDPGSTAWDSIGLVHMPDGECYINEDHLFSVLIQVNERKLPAKVRDELVGKKADEIERQQGRRPHKKEMRLLIEEAEMELLPKAFIGRSHTLVTFTDKDKLIVWTTSMKRAERMTTFALEWVINVNKDLKPEFRNIGFKHEQATIFTRMCKTSPGDSDVLCDGFSAVLKGGEGGETIRIRDCDLSSSDVQELLKGEDGYRVVEMQMIYDSTSNFGSTDHLPEMTFTVNEGMIFKKIVVPGIVSEGVEGFDSQLFITTQTLLKAHAALGEELGGEGGLTPDVVFDDDEI